MIISITYLKRLFLFIYDPLGRPSFIEKFINII